MNNGINLEIPLYFFILIFWAVFAILAIMTTVVSKTRLHDTYERLRTKFYDFSHKRHSH